MAIKIFIDQGHSPSNPNAGAEGNGLREQDLTYKIGAETARLLENVVLCREVRGVTEVDILPVVLLEMVVADARKR